jgi:predicted  nucleic acid-binding Zn-ribbon protein
MGSTLDALHHLQEIELQLAEVRQRIGARKQAVRAQEKRIAAMTTALEAMRKATRDKQIEADRLSLDIKSFEERMGRLRAALNTAKTNKEYSTVLVELNTLKADCARVEERTLALMTEIDADRKKLLQEEARLADEQVRLADSQKAARDYEAQVADRLKTLTTEREQAAAAIPPTVLSVFGRVAEKNDGQAMALVIRTNPRREEFVCSGCNMGVTLQQVNAIVSRDEPTICNICGRILYLERSAAPQAR